jgi:hypothetical protein
MPQGGNFRTRVTINGIAAILHKRIVPNDRLV